MSDIDTKNWGIIGHKNIVSYLGVSLSNHKFAHAYLLAGPRHLGKNTVVNKFVKTMMCEKYVANDTEGVPCGKCQSCQQLSKGIHPDYYQLELPEDKKNISIKQVRDWQRQLQHKSFLTKYKIGVIVGAEHLSIGAANALLKTIEEPSTNTIIILITDDLSLMLPTIISRSQVLKFSLVDDEKIYDYLQTKELSRDQMRDIAKLSFGLPGKAIAYMENADLFYEKRDEVQAMVDLISKPVHERINYLQNKFQKRDFITSQKIADQIMDSILLIIREMVLYKQASPNWHRLEFARDQIKTMSDKLELQQLINSIDKIIVWKSKVKQNASPQLFTEDLLLTF